MKHRAVYALSRLRTAGEKATSLDEDVPLYNVENIQVMNDGRSYLLVCTEIKVKNDQNTGKPNEDATGEGEKRVSGVQPTKRNTAKREVPTIEELTV